MKRFLLLLLVLTNQIEASDTVLQLARATELSRLHQEKTEWQNRLARHNSYASRGQQWNDRWESWEEQREKCQNQLDTIEQQIKKLNPRT